MLLRAILYAVSDVMLCLYTVLLSAMVSLVFSFYEVLRSREELASRRSEKRQAHLCLHSSVLPVVFHS
jgi:hypothetical protein